MKGKLIHGNYVKVSAHIEDCPVHHYEHYMVQSCDDTPEEIEKAVELIKSDYKNYTCQLDVEPIVRKPNED